MRQVLVIGIGNPDRGDDGAGPFVARLIADRPPPGVEAVRCSGDPADLLALWLEADKVVAVDACQSGTQPGTIQEFDACAAALPARLGAVSTHGFGLAAAVELARAMDCLPRSLTVIAIEAESFEPGAALSTAVKRAAHAAAAAIAETLKEGSCTKPA
jgi:hydrogenase maturation protease